MPVQFGTVHFYRAMADILNNDPVWPEKGKKLSYSMVYEYGPPVEKRFFVVFDEGRVTKVQEATDSDAEAADFVVSGSPDAWRGIFEKTINPTVAITKGHMKVKGKMMVLLKNMEAFNFVIDAMTKVDFK